MGNGLQADYGNAAGILICNCSPVSDADGITQQKTIEAGTAFLIKGKGELTVILCCNHKGMHGSFYDESLYIGDAVLSHQLKTGCNLLAADHHFCK